MSAAKDPENEIKGLRRSTRRRSTSTIDSEELDTPKTRRTTRQSTGLLNQVLEESTAKSDIETKSETEVRPARRLSRRNSDVTIDSPTVSLRLLRTRIVDTTVSDTPKKTRTRRTTLGNIHEEGQNDTPKKPTDTPKMETIASTITVEDIEKKTDTPIPPKSSDTTANMSLNKSPKMESKESKVIKDIVKEDIIEVTPIAQNPLTPILEVKKKLRSSLGIGSDNESEKTPQSSKLEEKAEKTPINIAKSADEIKRKLRPSLSICQPDETITDDKEIVKNMDEIVTPAKIPNTPEKIPDDNPEITDTEVDEIEPLYLSQDTDESNSPKRIKENSPNSSQCKKNPEDTFILKTPKSADVSELLAETSIPIKSPSLSSSQQDSPSQHEQSLPFSPCRISPKKEPQSVIISPKAPALLVSVEEPDSQIEVELVNSQADSRTSSPRKCIPDVALVNSPKSEENRRLRSSLSISKTEAEKSHNTVEDSSSPLKLSRNATPVSTPKSEEVRELRSSLNTSRTQVEDSSPVKLSRNTTPVATPKSEKSHTQADDSFSPLNFPSRTATPVNSPTSEISRRLRSSLSTSTVEVEKLDTEDSEPLSSPKRSRNATPVKTSDANRQLRSPVLSTSKLTSDAGKIENEGEDSDSSSPPKRSRNSTPVTTPSADASRQLRSSVSTSKVTSDAENVDNQPDDSDSSSSIKRSRNSTPVNTPTSDASRQLRSSLSTAKVTSDVEKVEKQGDDSDSSSPPKRSRNATPVKTLTSDEGRQLRSSLTSKVEAENTSDARNVENQPEDSDSPTPVKQSRNSTPVNTPTSDASRLLRSSLSISKFTSDAENVEKQGDDSDSPSPPKRSRNATPVKTLTSDEGGQSRSSLTSIAKAENTPEDSDASSLSKRNVTPVDSPISDEGRQLRSSLSTSEILNSPVSTPKPVGAKCLSSSLMAEDSSRELTPKTAAKVSEIEISPSVKRSDKKDKSNSFSVLEEKKAISPQLDSPVRVLRSSLSNSQSNLVIEECSTTTSKEAFIDLDDSEIEFRQTPLRMLNGNVKYINIPTVSEERVKPSSSMKEVAGSSSANQSMADTTADFLQKSTGSDKENESLNVTGLSNLNDSTQEDKSISQGPIQDETNFNKTKDDSELPNTPAKGAEDVLELRQRSILKTPTLSPITKTESETSRLILEASPKAKSITAEESDDELMNSFVNRPSSPLEEESSTENQIASGSPGLMIGATPANTPVQKRLLRQLSPGKNSPKPVSNIEQVEVSSDEEDPTLPQKELSAEKLTVLSDTSSDVCVELKKVSNDKILRQRAKSLPGTVESSKKIFPSSKQSKNMSLLVLQDSDESDGSDSSEILLTQDMKAKKGQTNGDAKFSSDENDDGNVQEDIDSNSEDRSYICTDEESDQNSLIDDEAMEKSGSDTPSEGSNDIIEVGESLQGSSSGEEVEEDDEYEDDSFIASDSEDVELLSGTGDDLSLHSAESDIELISQSKAAKQAFNKQKQYKRVQPISLESSDDEEVEKPMPKSNHQVISSDDEEIEKPTQKSNQLISSDEDESDAVLDNSVFIADSQDNVEEEAAVEEEIENVTIVLDKSPSLKAKQQEIKEKNKNTLENSVLEQSVKSHKNLRNIDEKEKSPGTKSKNAANFDVGNESVIILEPTPEIKKKKPKKGRKKSVKIVAQKVCEEDEIDDEEAPQLVKSPLINKKKATKGAKSIEVNDSPKPVDRQKKTQDSPKPGKKNKKSKKVSIEALKSPQVSMEKSPLLKKSAIEEAIKSPQLSIEDSPLLKKSPKFQLKNSPLVEKKKSKKDRKLSPEIVSEDEDKKSESKLHLVALNTRGRIPCIPISLLKELPESSPELAEITSPAKKHKKRKLQPEVVESKKRKHLKEGVEIVSLSKSMLPSSSGYTSCGFKEEMLNSNRIPRQSSIQLLNKKLRKESLKRKW